MSDIEGIVAFKDEVQLLSWSETSNGGAKIVFQLPSGECLDPFRDKPMGKKGGKRYMCVLVEIGDDEKPVERDEVGPLCKLAGMWASRADFQQWMRHWHPDTWMTAKEGLSEGTFGVVSDTDIAAEATRMVCGVTTRREIDTKPDGRERFNKLIRLPFGQSQHANQQA